ncbi:SRPBCC family protein [Methylocystis sp.]|uniref:SRPBCC family protein n=1 Tax=Methylocystis sp. TaxID=1911079 RepID=UPI003DA364B1
MKISIETQITVEAPPTRIWRILTDFPTMSSWNPFIRSISGALTPGATNLACKLRRLIEPSAAKLEQSEIQLSVTASVRSQSARTGRMRAHSSDHCR